MIAIRGEMVVGTMSRQYDGLLEGIDLPLRADNALADHVLSDCRVLVADDHRLYRDYLVTVLTAQGANVTCVDDATSFFELLTRPQHHLILVSHCIRGFGDMLRLCAADGQAHHLVVFGLPADNAHEIITCAESGVAGLHLRSESIEDLLSFCRQVLNGGTGCSPQVSAVLLRRLSELASQWPHTAEDELLTVREEEVLDLIKLGLPNREIANRLCVSTHTVKNHVHNVLNKLGVRSRAEAIALSRKPDRGGGFTRPADPRANCGSPAGTGSPGGFEIPSTEGSSNPSNS